MVGEIFSMYGDISNTPLRRIVESAFRIISELISESQSRRSALQAHNLNLATQQQPFPKLAPFSEVLRRISRDMSLDNSSARYEDPGSSSSQASQLQRPPYQQTSFPGDVPEKAYEQMPPQEFLGSGFYNALGVQVRISRLSPLTTTNMSARIPRTQPSPVSGTSTLRPLIANPICHS